MIINDNSEGMHHNDMCLTIYGHYSNKNTGATTTGKSDRVRRIQAKTKKELQEKGYATVYDKNNNKHKKF